jgi:hypothetical protein
MESAGTGLIFTEDGRAPPDHLSLVRRRATTALLSCYCRATAALPPRYRRDIVVLPAHCVPSPICANNPRMLPSSGAAPRTLSVSAVPQLRALHVVEMSYLPTASGTKPSTLLSHPNTTALYPLMANMSWYLRKTRVRRRVMGDVGGRVANTAPAISHLTRPTIAVTPPPC